MKLFNRPLTLVFGLLLTLMYVAPMSHASVCDQGVYDEANVLGGQANAIQQAGSQLRSQGADVHVITTQLSAFATPEQFVQATYQQCAEWQSPNHGVKTNLVVLIASPAKHKMAIFFGSDYNTAFASQVDRIKRDYMGPKFHGGDWAGGFIAAENHLGERLKSTLDESNKPVVNTTVNEASAPTDFHGLWVFLWILGGLTLLGLVFVIISKVRKMKAEEKESQQNAIASRGRVADMITDLGKQLLPYSNVLAKNAGAQYASDILDHVSEQFTKLGGSFSGDPSTDGMSVAYYKSLGTQYDRMEMRLEAAVNAMRAPSSDPVNLSENSSAVPMPSIETVKAEDEDHQTMVNVDYGTSHDTYRGNSNDLATGILIGEAFGGSHSEPSYSEPSKAFEDVPSSPEPDTSSSFSGSSSDFDSGSSSFDSGSSSSFDSGGGGGFGGGSSDF